MVKVAVPDMTCFDLFYRSPIDGIEVEAVTTYFAMEAIEEQRPIPL